MTHRRRQQGGRGRNHARGAVSHLESGLHQRVIDVANQIVRILQTHGQTEEAAVELRRVQVLALVILTEEHDQRLVMAERDGRRNHIELGNESGVPVVVGVEAKRQHAAEPGVRAGQLAGRHLVVQVRFQTGVRHETHHIQRFEMLGNRQGRGVVGQRVGVRQRDGATDRAGFGVDPVTKVNGQRAESEQLVVE